jgi:hypothetical protein
MKAAMSSVISRGTENMPKPKAPKPKKAGKPKSSKTAGGASKAVAKVVAQPKKPKKPLKMRTIKDSYKTGTITRKQAREAVIAVMKMYKEREEGKTPSL